MKELKCFTITLDYGSGAFPTFEQYISKKKEIDNMLRHIGINDIPADPELNLKKHPPRISYDFKVDINTPEYPWLIAELEQIGVRYLENYEMGVYYLYHYEFEFSTREMDEARLFEFRLMTHNFNGDKHPIYNGTQYRKEIICPVCGKANWHQLNDLHIDTSVIKKKSLIKPSGSSEYGSFILISDRMAKVLENEGITGYELRPVIHVGSEKKRKEVYQFTVNNILPPFSSRMRFESRPEEYCSSCGITGRFKWPLHYDSSSLTDVKDFNLSCEYTGNGAGYERDIVISRKARDLLINMKVQKEFQPVIIVDR